VFEKTKAFASYAVPDIDAARDFYGETLGLETSVNEWGVLILSIEGSQDVMVYPKPDHAPAAFTVLNFPVEDIDQAVDALAERGVEMQRFQGFDHDDRGIVRGSGPTIAWFHDPAGNILSVVEVD
jgi:catechol 2,3-dioxygenase-like lactoylglutathione lyase family enzyme